MTEEHADPDGIAALSDVELLAAIEAVRESLKSPLQAAEKVPLVKRYGAAWKNFEQWLAEIHQKWSGPPLSLVDLALIVAAVLFDDPPSVLGTVRQARAVLGAIDDEVVAAAYSPPTGRVLLARDVVLALACGVSPVPALAGAPRKKSDGAVYTILSLVQGALTRLQWYLAEVLYPLPPPELEELRTIGAQLLTMELIASGPVPGCSCGGHTRACNEKPRAAGATQQHPCGTTCCLPDHRLTAWNIDRWAESKWPLSLSGHIDRAVTGTDLLPPPLRTKALQYSMGLPRLKDFYAGLLVGRTVLHYCPLCEKYFELPKCDKGHEPQRAGWDSVDERLVLPIESDALDTWQPLPLEDRRDRSRHVLRTFWQCSNPACKALFRVTVNDRDRGQLSLRQYAIRSGNLCPVDRGGPSQRPIRAWMQLADMAIQRPPTVTEPAEPPEAQPLREVLVCQCGESFVAAVCPTCAQPFDERYGRRQLTDQDLDIVEGDVDEASLAVADRHMCAACMSLVLPELRACPREACPKSNRLMEFCEACQGSLPRSATRCPNPDCPEPEPVQRTRMLRVLCFTPPAAAGLGPLNKDVAR